MTDTIPRHAVTTIAMVQGNEMKHPVVIIGRNKWLWVGIGWIDEGPATRDELRRYPHVVDDVPAKAAPKRRRTAA